MKFFHVVLALTAIPMLVNAQQFASHVSNSAAVVSPLRLMQSNPINPPGLRMRNTGRTLTIVGSVMLVGGVIMAASADDLYYETTYNSSGSYSEGDPQGAIGIVMAVAGTGMTIPGIIFWNKGSKRYNKYLSEKRASASITGTGFSLRYQL